MQIRVMGSHIDVGQSLTQYVEENLEKQVKKYFDTAVNAEVHFSKDGHMFKVVITVNEGVKGGIKVKSDAEGGDVYGCFNEAAEKAAKQLRRYKGRIKNYRRVGGGIKSVEPDYKALNATKYVLPPLAYNVFEEMEQEESDEINSSMNVINEKSTDIETLSVEEAVMKMDLQDLPALVFINSKNKRINVVYHRKDGNISWIDPQV
ncbi:MAG: ribosome-associated translation inhibitor RaiA [Pelagibacterales bacterium]|nr:ribosome-associated translation inhibitor RaiA [Pelagibacterales bacterium]